MLCSRIVATAWPWSEMAATATAAAAAAEAKEDDELVFEKVQKHYFTNARKGIVLTAAELREYCKQQAWKPVPTEKKMRSLRHRWKYIGMHARWRRPPQYVGSSINKLGNIFVDVAEFKRNLAVFNKNKYILLVGTDLLSQKIACIAYSNKSQASWARGLGEFIVHLFPSAGTIISDRDTAISSASFQKKIKEQYDVDWIHLRNR